MENLNTEFEIQYFSAKHSRYLPRRIADRAAIWLPHVRTTKGTGWWAAANPAALGSWRPDSYQVQAPAASDVCAVAAPSAHDVTALWWCRRSWNAVILSDRSGFTAFRGHTVLTWVDIRGHLPSRVGTCADVATERSESHIWSKVIRYLTVFFYPSTKGLKLLSTGHPGDVAKPLAAAAEDPTILPLDLIKSVHWQQVFFSTVVSPPCAPNAAEYLSTELLRLPLSPMDCLLSFSGGGKPLGLHSEMKNVLSSENSRGMLPKTSGMQPTTVNSTHVATYNVLRHDNFGSARHVMAADADAPRPLSSPHEVVDLGQYAVHDTRSTKSLTTATFHRLRRPPAADVGRPWCRHMVPACAGLLKFTFTPSRPWAGIWGPKWIEGHRKTEYDVDIG
ncbi:hypothetical protein C8F04DRAFT_1186079 [Mycena alexandri]|uniref:Uncharacterized protein n=1 Tax=Mycena alexandri TaxID=1745969 RepID=A0AAD6SPH2_9AGAR|nr:hypothetical protein C8F04DRAFT_1186079 [Mycena alexandri]